MKIIAKSPYSEDALNLMEELSQSLEVITGDSGKASFNSEDVCVPRSLFVIAYDEDGKALGCGGMRPMDENTVEIKRMFAKEKSKGIGSKILVYLETEAKKMGYSSIKIETRLINRKAVSFYENRGYYRISNYGKYVNNPKAVCFEKSC